MTDIVKSDQIASTSASRVFDSAPTEMFPLAQTNLAYVLFLPNDDRYTIFTFGAPSTAPSVRVLTSTVEFRGSRGNVNIPFEQTSTGGLILNSTWMHIATTWTGGLSYTVDMATFLQREGGSLTELTPTYGENATGTTDGGVSPFTMYLPSAFRGNLAYLARWSRVLTTSELQQAIDNGPLSVPDGLIFCFANGIDNGPLALSFTTTGTITDGPPPPNINLGGGVTPPAIFGDTALSGGGAFDVEGVQTVPDGKTGETELSGGGALTAGGVARRAGLGAPVGGGGIAVSGLKATFGGTSATGGGSVSVPDARKGAATTVTVAGGGSITAEGERITGTVRGYTEVYGGGAITAQGFRGITGATILAAGGGIYVDGLAGRTGTANASGGGAIEAEGEPVIPDQLRGSAELSGGGLVWIQRTTKGGVTNAAPVGGGAITPSPSSKTVSGFTALSGGGAFFVEGFPSTPIVKTGSTYLAGGGAILDTGIFDEGIVDHYVRGWPVRWDGAVLMKMQP